MSRRVPGSPITVSFSTHGAWMPAWMVQHVAATADADGVDIDATSAFGVWLATLTGTTEKPIIPIRSIWFPCDSIKTPRIRRFVDFTHIRQPDDPPLVVLTFPGPGNVHDVARRVIHSAEKFSDWNVAIGLPSASLRGGRPHLVQLGVMRRFAEEWDLGLAIDLTGRFDPTWEAEAAVSRIASRLKLLRVSASAPSRSAVGRDRVVCRALHAAIDRVEWLDVALAPAAPVPFPVTPRAVARSTERAAGYISERARFHAEAVREGADRFEDSPSARGS